MPALPARSDPGPRAVRRPGPDARRDPREHPRPGGRDGQGLALSRDLQGRQGPVGGGPERDRRRPGNNWHGTSRPPGRPPSSASASPGWRARRGGPTTRPSAARGARLRRPPGQDPRPAPRPRRGRPRRPARARSSSCSSTSSRTPTRSRARSSSGWRARRSPSGRPVRRGRLQAVDLPIPRGAARDLPGVPRRGSPKRAGSP